MLQNSTKDGIKIKIRSMRKTVRLVYQKVQEMKNFLYFQIILILLR